MIYSEPGRIFGALLEDMIRKSTQNESAKILQIMWTVSDVWCCVTAWRTVPRSRLCTGEDHQLIPTRHIGRCPPHPTMCLLHLLVCWCPRFELLREHQRRLLLGDFLLPTTNVWDYRQYYGVFTARSPQHDCSYPRPVGTCSTCRSSNRGAATLC